MEAGWPVPSPSQPLAMTHLASQVGAQCNLSEPVPARALPPIQGCPVLALCPLLAVFLVTHRAGGCWQGPLEAEGNPAAFLLGSWLPSRPKAR